METSVRDPHLWHQAKCRAKFKSHLFTYLAVNALLWAIWGITAPYQTGLLPWPAWSTIFWGFGVLIQGINTYGSISKSSLMEREYERLVRRKEGR